MKTEWINLGDRQILAINELLFSTVSSNPISFVIICLQDCHLSFMIKLKKTLNISKANQSGSTDQKTNSKA